MNAAEAAQKYPLEVRKATAWHRGALDWKLKPIQKRLTAAYRGCKNFLFVSLIARQTGKSYNWVKECIELSIKRPGARIRYGTAFQSDLEEFIRPIVETIIEDAPDDVRPKYRSKGSKYVFPNKSEIKLVGLDLHPNGLRGNALDLVIIEEAGFVSKLRYIFSSIILPMLRSRPNLRVVMSSTPSETPDHEFTEFWHQALEEGNYFKATIDDDEKCEEHTKDTLARECGGKDSTTYRREFLVEFVTDSDLAIVPEFTDAMVREVARDEYFTYYHRYVAQDLGVVDFTAHLYAYYDFRRATLVIEDETQIRGPQTTTDVIGELVKMKEKQLWGEATIYRRISDNDNLILLNDLATKHQIYFRATDKDELPAMINHLRLLVKQNRLAVHPRCKMLIGCLKYGIYNDRKDKRDFAKSKVYGHYDHLAALVYLARKLDQNTNPVPAFLGASPATHHMPKLTPEMINQNSKALSTLMPNRFIPNG